MLCTVLNCAADDQAAAQVAGAAVGKCGSDDAGIAEHEKAAAVVSYITATIANTTVSSNVGYGCDGIVSLSDMTLSNSTVAFNMSSSTLQPGRDVAGVCAAVAVTPQSSILAKNTRFVSGTGNVAADLSTTSGTTISGNNNLIMGTTAGTTAPGDTITLDPNLGPLHNSGGSTKIHAFNSNSPAAGVGNNLLRLASDQRGTGFARMTGEKTDIGAFQSGNGIFASGFE